MFKRSRLATSLNLQYPICLAPLAGPNTVPLVAAVSNAGGLGIYGANTLAPHEITDLVVSLRNETGKNSFGINLWVPTPEDADVNNAFHENPYTKAYHILGIPNIKPRLPIVHDFNEQLQALIAAKPPVISFVMGIPSADQIKRAKMAGIYLMGTATNVAEAKAIEDAGLDCCVASGCDGGGHRGTFIGKPEDSLIGTFSLIPTVVDAVKIPVLGSGGISDGRGIAAAMCLGADAVHIGTAFLAAAESGASISYKRRLADFNGNPKLTRVWSGKLGRGIPNKFSTDFPNALSYPIQYGWTKAMRKASVSQDNPDYQPLWAGQAFSLARQGTATSIFKKMVHDARNLGC